MTLLSRGVKVHLAFGFIDMRKGILPRRFDLFALAIGSGLKLYCQPKRFRCESA
jgi:hypothetical protein